jgi:hypothetical protein
MPYKDPEARRLKDKRRRERMKLIEIFGCSKCADLPWRRPIGRPCACRKYYAAEHVACVVPTLKSIGGMCADAGED